jgi:23S rRNA pseudouridine1911/1915/1917 synthase
MDRILEYRIKDSDLDATAGGILGKVLKQCMGLTAHEISHAKFTPGGISVLRKDSETGSCEPVTVKDRVAEGDVVRVQFSDVLEQNENKVIAVKGDITILYEDEDVIVLNKPAGMVSHPSHGHYRDSLANYLAGYYEEKGKTGRFRAVGRLDKDTSGAILFASNAPAASRLFRQKETGLFKKTYLAVVANPFESNDIGQWNTIDAPIGPIPGTLMKQQIISSPVGKNALTRYSCLGSFDSGSVIEAEIDTGRTHQIRVHMAYIGHPLIGDKLYGNVSGDTSGANRSLLHAWKMMFVRPFGDETIHITAPIPDDIKRYL